MFHERTPRDPAKEIKIDWIVGTKQKRDPIEGVINKSVIAKTTLEEMEGNGTAPQI